MSERKETGILSILKATCQIFRSRRALNKNHTNVYDQKRQVGSRTRGKVSDEKESAKVDYQEMENLLNSDISSDNIL